MNSTYFINQQLTIYPVEQGQLALVRGNAVVFLSDPLQIVLLKLLLSQPANLEELLTLKQLKSYVPFLILRELKFLLRNNILVTSNEQTELEINSGLSSTDVFETAHPIHLIELEQYGMEEYLVESGVSLDPNASLSVVIVNDFLDDRLSILNQQFIEEKRTWQIVKPVGKKVMISPVLNGVDQLCWECLTYRMQLHQPLNLLKQQGETPLQIAKPIYSKESLRLAAKIIGNNLVHLNETRGKLLEVDLVTGEKQFHHVSKRPQCTACNEGWKQIDYKQVNVFEKHEKVSSMAGGYRAFSAQETFDNYKHLISPITGVLAAIKEYKKLDGVSIFNYSSGRNIALQSKSLFWLNNHMRSNSGGKGTSNEQAKTGALCEAIERYSMMHHGQPACKQSSLVALGDVGIHPNKCMNFSDWQLENRTEINRQKSAFYALVPVAFNEEEVIDWTKVVSLVSHEEKYLPSAFCYAQYPHADDQNLIAYPDSNGCAAGNTHAEAVLQGTFELIERDAAAIWWYNQIPRPQVDLNALNNAYIHEMQTYYKSISRRIYVLDITTDIGVPTFVAVSYNLETGKEILYGFGCHVEAEIAIERSIIELNQLIPNVLTERPQNFDTDLSEWLDNHAIEEHPFLYPSNTVIAQTPKNHVNGDISKAIRLLQDRFKALEIDWLMLDLTQPDIGLPVVKVIAPGLRHFWRRTAEGRLYDVPVKMGWLKEKNTEETLNQLSIFI